MSRERTVRYTVELTGDRRAHDKLRQLFADSAGLEVVKQVDYDAQEAALLGVMQNDTEDEDDG